MLPSLENMDSRYFELLSGLKSIARRSTLLADWTIRQTSLFPIFACVSILREKSASRTTALAACASAEIRRPGLLPSRSDNKKPLQQIDCRGWVTAGREWSPDTLLQECHTAGQNFVGRPRESAFERHVAGKSHLFERLQDCTEVDVAAARFPACVVR